MSGTILFLLLACSHVLGAVYLQSDVPGVRQRTPGYRIRQIVCSLLPGYLLLLPNLILANIWIPFVMTAAWLALEWIRTRRPGKHRVLSHRHSSSVRMLFVASHILPIAIAAMIAHFGTVNQPFPVNGLWHPMQAFLSSLKLHMTGEDAFRWLLMFLLLGKPANMIIREMNGKENIMHPVQASQIPVLDAIRQEPEYRNAGSLIGTLERLLIAIMILLGQYAAIGLIFTAKSITRYDRISKDPSFAEYYLVGTLMSTLIAIVTVLVLKPA